jgi:hypothetical protein
MAENNGFIPNHQFSFRERLHNRTNTSHHTRINEILGNKQYCSAAFLDISQASDKVWHTGLMVKTVSLSELFHFTQILSA